MTVRAHTDTAFRAGAAADALLDFADLNRDVDIYSVWLPQKEGTDLMLADSECQPL